MNYIIDRTRAGVTCKIGGRPVLPRNDLYNHSPDGFEFGFGGSGPAQLALGILADAVGDEMALKKYQQFKWDIVSRQEMNHWEISREDVIKYCNKPEPEPAKPSYRMLHE